jgi:tetratricopeptide (TPR) repeat protein
VNKLIFLSVLFLTTPGLARGIDYLALSSVLLRDGNYDRAQGALANALKEWDDIDQQNYYLLNGLYHLRTNNIEFAISELQKIEDPEYLTQKRSYLSQAYLYLKNNKKALEWISKIEINRKTPDSVKYLKVKILVDNEKIQEAFALLRRLKAEGDSRSVKLIIHYLFQLNLFEEAFKEMRSYISRNKDSQLYTQMAKALISKKEYKKATYLLEEGHLKNPEDKEILKLLAATYDLSDKKKVAADLYTKLAYMDSSYAHLAAEYLKQNGKINLAHVLNAVVTQPTKQITQKLALYLDEERFSLARSLEIPLRQYGVYKDDEIKYAMAYAHLVDGDFSYSKSLLKDIKKQKLISKSLKLLKLVEDCEREKWVCYGTL